MINISYTVFPFLNFPKSIYCAIFILENCRFYQSVIYKIYLVKICHIFFDKLLSFSEKKITFRLVDKRTFLRFT